MNAAMNSICISGKFLYANNYFAIFFSHSSTFSNQIFIKYLRNATTQSYQEKILSFSGWQEEAKENVYVRFTVLQKLNLHQRTRKASYEYRLSVT